MRRRDFLSTVVVASASVSHARGQEAGRTYRIGFLIPSERESAAISAFFDELRKHGFVEGENLVVVPGGFGIRNNIAQHAAAVVSAAPDAIVCGPDLQIRALQAVTRTVPLIGMTEDMVGAGLVDSLARPGGNTTGISLLSPELDAKRQEILLEVVPHARRIAALTDSRVTSPQHLQALKNAAGARGVELLVRSAATAGEIPVAISGAKRSGAEALNFLATPLFLVNSRMVIQRVARARLPAIYQWPEMAMEGGLIAYGPGFRDAFRQRARMVIKILRGAKPSDVPIEQPTKFALVANLRTSRALGLTFPASLLHRADEVIE